VPNKVKFFYSAPRTLTAFQSAVASNFMTFIDVKQVSHKGIPSRATYVVTTGHLGTPVERFAARLGAQPVVLPEAHKFLDEKVSLAINAGSELVIVGYDLEPAL
jgi:hypothetical protein